MIEKLKDLPTGITGVKAVGKISKEDYDQVFTPLIDDARREGRRIRFLYQLGPEFEGFTPAAAWEDAKIGLHYLRLFEGCAVVTDVAWVREMTRLMGFLMPCPVRQFGNQELDRAVAWLVSLPEGAAVSHRLLCRFRRDRRRGQAGAPRAGFRRAVADGGHMDRSAWQPARAGDPCPRISRLGEFRKLPSACALRPRSSPRGEEDRICGRQQAGYPRAAHRRTFRQS